MLPMFAEFALPDTFFVGTVGSAIFGLLGGILLLLVYKAFDWITPKLDVQDELNKGNMAVSVVVAVLLASTAYIVAHVVH